MEVFEKIRIKNFDETFIYMLSLSSFIILTMVILELCNHSPNITKKTITFSIDQSVAYFLSSIKSFIQIIFNILYIFDIDHI